MADPLTPIAEEFAPAPTNYFDKGQAQTLISRYGNANRSAASSKRLADTAIQSQRFQSDIASEERAAAKESRDAILMSRDDIEYGERKNADETRSGFLKSFMEELDPKDEDYNSKLVSFMSDLPSNIQKDPTFVDIVKIRSKQADEADTERRRLKEIDIAQKNRVELVDARAKYNPILANLTPEDLAALPRDEKGEPDMVIAMQKAMEKKYANELKQDKAKVDVRKGAAIELIDRRAMNDAEKARYDETEEIVSVDAEAFPSKVAMLQNKYGKEGRPAPLEVLKLKPEYKEAAEWDKQKFKKEVNAAMDYDNPEGYVNMGGMEGISDAAKNRRMRVWEYAHQNDGKETVTETETVTPKQGDGKPVTFTDRVVEGFIVRTFSDGTVKRKPVPAK